MSNIIWLASYPRSGNIWLQAFLYNLFNDSRQVPSAAAIGDFCTPEPAAVHFLGPNSPPLGSWTREEVAARRGVDAHVVEDQRAALETVGEDVNRGLGPGYEATIDPDAPIRRLGRDAPSRLLGRGIAPLRQGVGAGLSVRIGHARKIAGPRGNSAAAQVSGSPIRFFPDGSIRVTRDGASRPHGGQGDLMMPSAIRKATSLLNLTLALYRDMTLNALRLLPGRH